MCVRWKHHESSHDGTVNGESIIVMVSGVENFEEINNYRAWGEEDMVQWGRTGLFVEIS